MSRRILCDFPGQISLEEYMETLHAAMAEANYEWAKGLVRIFVNELGKGVAYETEELEGVALYGLAKAIKEFDSPRVAFRTFATHVIHNELMDHLKRYSKKTLKTVALEEVKDIVDTRSTEKLGETLDCYLGTSKKENIKLGLYAMKMRSQGIKIKELQKRTGIPISKWYQCIKEAKAELRKRMESR